MAFTEEGNVVIQGNLTLNGTLSPPLPRASLAQETLTEHVIPLTDWKVWDAMPTNLPATSATDDLGLIGGTFATGSPSIQTSDLKAAGATSRYARAQVVIPHEYVTGQTLELRFSAGMITTVADTTCTLDVEAFRSDNETGIGSDICADVAKDINGGVSYANYDFSITPATLAPGDVLDVRIHIACNDGGSGTAVIACVGKTSLRCDTKG